MTEKAAEKVIDYLGALPLNRIKSILTTYIYGLEFTESIKYLCDTKQSNLGINTQKQGVNP